MIALSLYFPEKIVIPGYNFIIFKSPPFHRSSAAGYIPPEIMKAASVNDRADFRGLFHFLNVSFRNKKVNSGSSYR